MRREICAIVAEFLQNSCSCKGLFFVPSNKSTRTWLNSSYPLRPGTCLVLGVSQMVHSWTHVGRRCSGRTAPCFSWRKHIKQKYDMRSPYQKKTYSGIHCAYCAYTLCFWMSLVLSLRFVFDLKTRINIGYHKRCRFCILHELHNLCHKEATMATLNGTKRQTPMQYNMAPQQSTRCNATYEMQARCVHLSNKLIQQTKVAIIHQK